MVLRPEAEGTWVERLGEHEFRAPRSRSAERSVALNDVTTPAALVVHRRAARSKLGVRRGCWPAPAPTEGDVVWIGAFCFDYVPEV